jgi:hypothetical protein
MAGDVAVTWLYLIGGLIGLGMIFGVAWFAVRIEEAEEADDAMEADAQRLRPGADAPQIDEGFAEQLAPVDQQARDKGAV